MWCQIGIGWAYWLRPPSVGAVLAAAPLAPARLTITIIQVSANKAPIDQLQLNLAHLA